MNMSHPWPKLRYSEKPCTSARTEDSNDFGLRTLIIQKHSQIKKRFVLLSYVAHFWSRGVDRGLTGSATASTTLNSSGPPRDNDQSNVLLGMLQILHDQHERPAAQQVHSVAGTVRRTDTCYERGVPCIFCLSFSLKKRHTYLTENNYFGGK